LSIVKRCYPVRQVVSSTPLRRAVIALKDNCNIKESPATVSIQYLW
jgi:hypothetical protein